mmetsp:Transcript_1432/g.4153  ORF Transcript_1432/g.4153 Transcript_1432/m.4153 type:complete len:95 (+) Transcript_1432:505-789(+)
MSAPAREPKVQALAFSVQSDIADDPAPGRGVADAPRPRRRRNFAKISTACSGALEGTVTFGDRPPPAEIDEKDRETYSSGQISAQGVVLVALEY